MFLSKYLGFSFNLNSASARLKPSMILSLGIAIPASSNKVGNRSIWVPSCLDT